MTLLHDPFLNFYGIPFYKIIALRTLDRLFCPSAKILFRLKNNKTKMAKFSVFKDLKPTTPVPQISFKSAFYDENESAVVFHTKKRSCTKSKAIYYTSPLEDITWAYLDSVYSSNLVYRTYSCCPLQS